jgi:hypothetical protein
MNLLLILVLLKISFNSMISGEPIDLSKVNNKNMESMNIIFLILFKTKTRF